MFNGEKKSATAKKCSVKEKVAKKGSGPTMLVGLLGAAYSQARSHYGSTRGLLSAAFPPWTGSPFLRQPGHSGLRRSDHIDAELSADTRST